MTWEEVGFTGVQQVLSALLGASKFASFLFPSSPHPPEALAGSILVHPGHPWWWRRHGSSGLGWDGGEDGGKMNQRKDNRRIGGIGESFTQPPPIRRFSVFPGHALELKYVQGWGSQEL